MQKLIIEGNRKLRGEIKVQGAKNSVLPILAACILPENSECVLTNCPDLSDVYCALRILKQLGVKGSFDKNTIRLCNTQTDSFEISEELMMKMRSSIIFLGAVLGARGKCTLYYPGGCELGPRPIDMHINALKKMGADIKEKHGALICTAEKGLSGAKINLPFPSVGATENIILAAVKANGETVIYNAAREPEIKDLAQFLNKCGAKIKGAGESTIIINGVDKLLGCEYSIMPDRIAAGTYIAAAAATNGEALLDNICVEDMESFLPVFEQMGCKIYTFGKKLYINAKHPLNAVKTIRTMPHPGFPTDIQAITMAVLCKAKGTSVFVENIFESRFRHVDALCKMGADIRVAGKAAVVEGVEALSGARVSATDLRSGAALVTAALSACGTSEITEICHIDRGYENIERYLTQLGAKIKREQQI